MAYGVDGFYKMTLVRFNYPFGKLEHLNLTLHSKIFRMLGRFSFLNKEILDMPIFSQIDVTDRNRTLNDTDTLPIKSLISF